MKSAAPSRAQGQAPSLSGFTGALPKTILPPLLCPPSPPSLGHRGHRRSRSPPESVLDHKFSQLLSFTKRLPFSLSRMLNSTGFDCGLCFYLRNEAAPSVKLICFFWVF